MKKIIIFLSIIFPAFVVAQGLSPEGRKNWNKAQIYIEQAQTEAEWQLAIDALEVVKASDPGYSKVYLELGNAFSKLNSVDALSKAKSYYQIYIELMPDQVAEVQDRIDRLEAQYEINATRDQETFFKSLVGKWSPNENWGAAVRDIEIIYNGKNLLLSYYSFLFTPKEGVRWGRTSLITPIYDSDTRSLSCTYQTNACWEDDDALMINNNLVIPYQENIDNTIMVDVRYPTGKIFREIFYKY